MDEEFFQPSVILEYDEEIEFYGFIRKHLICFLSGVFLYLSSFYIIRCFITRTDNDELYAGDEDFLVYRVAVWMCSASLAVAFGANILLPFSMIGLEVLHIYPDNFYTKWLNGSLIVSMWNYVFFLSNLSLFVFLPFAYFFIESQGLSFPRRPQRPFLARVYETILVCVLVIVVLIGIVDVAYSLLLQHSPLSFSFFHFTSVSTPLLYSFVSSMGVFVLLLSTPFGFVRIFDVFSTSLKNGAGSLNNTPIVNGRQQFVVLTSVEKLQAKSIERRQRRAVGEPLRSPTSSTKSNGLPSFLPCQNGGADYHGYCNGGGDAATVQCHFFKPGNGAVNGEKPRQRRASIRESTTCAMERYWSRVTDRLRPMLNWCILVWNLLKYPVMMLVLIFFAVLSVTMVIVNTLQLLIGYRGLPDYVQCVEVHSRHTFGIVGALIEIAVILYIILASFVGIYSLPIIRNIRPKYGRTSMTCIILNCGVVLLLSSALPVLARILGITSFDLLGAYGRINWISNFMLVISYNVLFATSSTFCLLNTFTLPVRRELIKRFCSLCNRKYSTSSTNSLPTTSPNVSFTEKAEKFD